METTRQQKVARLLQKEIAEIFQNEPHLLHNQCLVTVTCASITRDLSIARVLFKCFATDKTKLSIL